MTSLEALESWFSVISTQDKIRWEEHYKVIKKDLDILECFRKIPKQDLKEFIDWQIRYEKNMKTWLEGCNADLAKEDPTKHLIKIKEWLENE